MLLDCNPWRYGCSRDGNAINIVKQWLVPAKVNPILGSKYPYFNGQTASCNSSGATAEETFPTDFTQSANSPSTLLDALKNGPVLTHISANNAFFKGYEGGIINNSGCFSNRTLDHTVVAVGFGVDQGASYFIYRNSWGTSWGEAGYVRVTATNEGFGICGNQSQNWSLSMQVLQ